MMMQKSASFFFFFFQRARELMDADDYEEAMRVLEEGWSREYEEGNNG